MGRANGVLRTRQSSCLLACWAPCAAPHHPVMTNWVSSALGCRNRSSSRTVGEAGAGEGFLLSERARDRAREMGWVGCQGREGWLVRNLRRQTWQRKRMYHTRGQETAAEMLEGRGWFSFLASGGTETLRAPRCTQGPRQTLRGSQQHCPRENGRVHPRPRRHGDLGEPPRQC